MAVRDEEGKVVLVYCLNLKPAGTICNAAKKYFTSYTLATDVSGGLYSITDRLRKN